MYISHTHTLSLSLSLLLTRPKLWQELAGMRTERDTTSEALQGAEARALSAQEAALPLQAKLRAAAAQVAQIAL